MKTVLIYGRSDDLIEVEGNFCDEFSAYCCWAYLHFGDGTVVKVGYDQVPDKGWHIEIVTAGTATAEFEPAEFEDGSHYTDRLRLTGDGVQRCECWETKDGPSLEDVEKWLESLDISACSLEKWRDIMSQLQQ